MKDLPDELDVSQVDLVGSSYGGGIAAQFALDYPERVRRIVFIDAEVFGEGSNQAWVARLPFGLNRAFTWYVLGGGPLAGNLSKLACFDQIACAESTDFRLAREALVRIRGTTDALFAYSKTPRDQCIPTYLRLLSIPAMAIWGEEDKIIPPENGQRLANMLNARLEWIPQAGHIPHIERPELVATLILDYLNPN